MNSKTKNSFFFVLAATASMASVAGSSTAKAACDCLPSTNIKNFSQADFRYLGSYTTGYEMSIVDDSVYRWASSSPTAAWIDYDPPNYTAVTSYQACRYAYTGSSISCGSAGSHTSTTNAHVEKSVSTFGTHLPSNSAWDLYKIKVWGGAPFTPTSLPVRLYKAP